MIIQYLKIAKYGAVAAIGAAIAFNPIKALGVREGLNQARMKAVEQSLEILRNKGEYTNEANKLDNYQLCLALLNQLPDKPNDCESLRHHQQDHATAE